MARYLQLSEDHKLRERYFDEVADELAKIRGDKKVFYEHVNKKIQSIFEQSYLRRLDSIYEKCTQAQDLEKRRMFLRLKKFLVRSRVLQF